MRASIAAHASWAHTEDRRARTANATKANMDRFERLVDPEGRLTPEERAKRAENARKAHFQRMAYKSAKVRQARKAGAA
ncbi:hypothetical protein AWB93_13060 [Mycobacterium bohemicum]|uniref:Uncharacterized protein n=1 Tax=Mycobacterium bohemicum TaxID=56425 RepID=A0A1X1R3L8_MYCBE|nr:hypothetical protein [Mycobacterium bohemicum]ORU98871.1 hypothetical protein AWB93_13060 [Mycobacterium bohemicum]